MEDYVNQIEKFLRGYMSPKEECTFKNSLITDGHMRTCAFIMAFIMKTQKTE